MGLALAGDKSAAPAKPASGPEKNGRVVVASTDGALESFNPNAEAVRKLVREGLLKLTGKKDDRSAWLSLVSTQDTIGIKVLTAPGRYSGTRKEVVAGVIEGLREAGIAPGNIVLWDRTLVEMQVAGYGELASKYGVRLEGAQSAGWDDKTFYESSIIGKPVFGDFEFDKKGEDVGRNSFMSKLVSKRITKIISIAPLLNHNTVGVSGHLYSLAIGSMDNTIRFENETSRMAVAVPEIYNMPQLADRMVLAITDALLCQYQGESRTLLHYSAVLNELRFSRDPVALDALSVEELERQRELANVPSKKEKLEIYGNAALLELGVADTKQIKIERVMK
ncbi:MAG TPA: hypothetical protein VGH19_06020 [Verrucomicrobiae bacterium]